ncbi:hypothetical protein RJ640_027230 [Escallonia rubra]|uniref:Protein DETOXIFICATION n=1 Tax=Escallonia rubra TaxID=112253 RepID=A0AA88RZM0_9ASTE|nr:hypothetical protein RJ640_027230 [Escallonia rubra]
MEENPVEQFRPMPSSTLLVGQKWPANFVHTLALSEVRKQLGIAAPLVAMNLLWFARISITTSFLGRLGKLELVGGTLGFTFANVTGFSVLNGLCSAMEPVCGQAYGAQNFRLLHKTLVMVISLLLLTSLPISFLWVNVDKILLQFGQQEDISNVAKQYLLYLLPDLVVRSFMFPLKEYLSSQSLTAPIMLSSALALAFHVPVNILLSKAKGLEGVSMAVWITDLIVVILLALYVFIAESGKSGKWKEGGWWQQGTRDWIKFLKLSAPCCFTTCLEWWCYEILVLTAGCLANAKQAVGVLAIVLNFDYILYSVSISLATVASTRVSNKLGANQADLAYQSATVALAVSTVLSCIGGLVTVAARGTWGQLFSHDKAIIRGVKKTMLLMASVEVVNFPLAVCGGIVRGTAKPRSGMYANLAGFYLLALPLGVILAFKVHLGLGGLLTGFLVGAIACLVLLVVSVARIDWVEEAGKARVLVRHAEDTANRDEGHKKSAIVENIALLELERSKS